MITYLFKRLILNIFRRLSTKEKIESTQSINSDAELGKDTLGMIYTIAYLEYRIDCIELQETFEEANWKLKEAKFNFGREMLNRKLAPAFSTPKKINDLTRKYLIRILSKITKNYPSIHTPEVDKALLELLKKEAGIVE